MTDEQRQRLSELQDDELDRASAGRLLDAIAVDPQLRGTWERYDLIGRAMRGEAINPSHRTIADGVRRSLEAEPAIRSAPRFRRGPSWQRSPWVGLALAASVAGVAAVTAPLFFQEAAPPSGLTATGVPLAEQTGVSGQRWHLNRPDLANKLDLFLVTHQASMPSGGAKGILPYATLVSYEMPR